jgi:hypothetical protein
VLTKGINFLNFDDVQSSKASSIARPGADGSGTANASANANAKVKTFYEDPSLADDEQKAKEELEEKLKVEELLRPKTFDLDTPASPGMLSQNPGSVAPEEIKETDEKAEDDEK